MAGDNLFVILAMIRAELPEVPDEAWEKIKHMLSDRAGGTSPYVPAQRKRSHLELLAQADESTSNEQLSRLLGVGVRRVKQLKTLR